MCCFYVFRKKILFFLSLFKQYTTLAIVFQQFKNIKVAFIEFSLIYFEITFIIKSMGVSIFKLTHPLIILNYIFC